MRAVVVSHDPTEVSGLVGRRLVEHGFDLEEMLVCDSTGSPESHRPFPSLDGVDLVVAMGSPWSVYDTSTIGTWIARELAFVRAVHDRGIPYLGVCFGGQVLAAALGATVDRAPRPELGWCAVESFAPDVIASGPWFQWHEDGFTLPAGAVELARSEVGAQAFRVGRSVAVQFHPEVDARVLASWLDESEPPDPLFTQLGVDPARVIAEALRMDAALVRQASTLVDWVVNAD